MARKASDHRAGITRSAAADGGHLAARALIIAEDGRFRHVVSHRLQKAGFGVETTDDGIEALSAAHRDPPDLIVVDHIVGWLDVGYMLTRLTGDLRTAGVPILLLAPIVDRVLARTCHGLGVTYMVKRAPRRRARPGLGNVPRTNAKTPRTRRV